MDEFVSTFTNRLDAKGRVSIPAPFRAVLAVDGFDGLYCCPTLDQQAIDAGGNRLRQVIGASIANFEPFSEDHELLSTTLIGDSEILRIDQDGRVVLTDTIKAHAGITDRVDLRRPGLQVSDLGAGAFRSIPGRGQEPAARPAETAGTRPSRDGCASEDWGMNTAGSGVDPTDAAGGPARHVPVMLEEVVHFLAPVAGGVYIDGTFGAGGYSAAILARGATVIAIDRDPRALAAGAAMAASAGGRLTLVEGRFSALDAIARAHRRERVDGVVLDIGVSSMQLDDAGRGFSFRGAGPLDMRMGGDGPSAADVVNRMDAQALARVIAVLGEEKKARAVARAIDKARAEKPLTGTIELAEIVARAVGGRRDSAIHPATRTFQALRIFVNRELEELAEALAASERVLGPGGRLVVVSFHSLEDRIVKRFLADRSATLSGASRHRPDVAVAEPTFALLARGAVSPGAAETTANPRARSARLRAATRTAAVPRPLDRQALGVPVLPEFIGGA